MGMSASQMRYLMISGKKSDIEYQGQQINQQRTTLATQSSAYNTQLLNLAVPTPPSSEDFTKLTYTYFSNGTKCTMKALTYMTQEYQNDSGTKNYDAGTYVVNFTRESVGPKASSSGTVPAKNTGVAGAPVYSIVRNGASQALQLVTTKNADGSQTEEQLIDESNIGYLKQINTLSDQETFYKFKDGNVVQYIPASDLEDLTAGAPGAEAYTYYVDDQAKLTETSKLYGCSDPQYSSSGRLQSIKDEKGNTLDFTVAQETDEVAYNDAYQEYVYQKQKYENTMESINAELEIIQAQDKKLELKLSDLDTQQSAIQIEMDAVKKVIDKNVETTFKTFG